MHIYSFSYLSKFLFTSLTLFLSTLGCLNCEGKRMANMGEDEVYVIQPGDSDNRKDLKWSEYLFDHLKRRGGDDEAPVFYDIEVQNCKYIIVHIDSNINGDFAVSNSDERLYLTAKDEHTMLWLLYQFMRKLGDIDKRFSHDDLPASILTFNDTVGKIPFKYRDIYTPTAHNSDSRGILGLHNTDTYWGLWGHNIALTLPDEPDESIYATHNSERAKSQYCFSSNKLFQYISDYIYNKCGSGEEASYNFAILPNDNGIACTCSHCKSIGNSEKNASPAVTQMIEKLAQRYPKHKFFTSAYRTTLTPGDNELPDNAGVIISAMEWSIGTENNKKAVEKFKSTLKNWSEKTNNIYVWDYINNYDDYFTPFPMLSAMQRRFKIYRENNVNGIFLNGSGYDFSIFEDMHTHVLSALMIKPDIDITNLVADYFKRTYPIAGGLLTDYYIQLLKDADSRNKPFPFYGGIDEKIKAYIDIDAFVKFYNSLTKLKSRAGEEEAYNLRKIITALSFTYLEITRHCGYSENGYATIDERNSIGINTNTYDLLEIFDDGYKAFELSMINEAGDMSSSYVDGWKKYILKPTNKKSAIYGKKLTVVSENGEKTYEGLTDGAQGLPVNYYYGWNIIPEHEISIELPKTDAKYIKVDFFAYPRHKIQVPSLIEIYKGDKVIMQHKPQKPLDDGPQLVSWKKEVNKGGDNTKLTMKIYSSGHYHIAIDEIELTQD